MNKTVYWLKNNFVIRAVLKPYMDFRKQIAYKKYVSSKDSQFIRSLKDKYSGKRCFIIGNGPSLTISDLEKLSKEYTFAANFIFKSFDKTNWRPSFYLAVDPNFIQTSYKELNKYNLPEMFLATDVNFDMTIFNTNATRIFEYTKFKINKWNDMSAHISEDVSKYFSVGYTVTFTAIQFALYMGFKEIYLLGVDFSYSSIRDKSGKIHKDNDAKDYFFGEKYAETVLPYYTNLHAYQVAKKYADEHKVKIFNATRGGKLEVFDRVNFDDIL